MNRIIIFLLVFISNSSLSQEHRSLFQTSTLKENKVVKILEYNPNDSIHFFEKFPEGYYSKYDKLGRMTESNAYSPYLSDGVWHSNMFTNYYLYDSLDHQISFIQIHPKMEAPFSYLELSSYNHSDTVKIAYLKEGNQQNSECKFVEKLNTAKPQFWSDTLKMSKRHYFLKSLNDSTITLDIYFDKKGKKDSTLLRAPARGIDGQYFSENTTKYSYCQNGKIQSIVVNSYQINKSRELYWITEYYFLENELLDKLRTYVAQTNEWTVSKFIYFFRSNSTTLHKSKRGGREIKNESILQC